MRMHVIPRGAAALLLLVAGTPLARDAGAQPDTARALQRLERAATDPSLRSGLRIPIPTLTLTATTTDKEVRGQFGIPFGTPRLIGNLTLTAPVDGDAAGGRTTVADRDGLARKASVEGGLFYYRWRPQPDLARQDEICAAAKRTVAEENARGGNRSPIDTGALDFCSSTGKAPERFRRQIRDAVSWGFPISLALNGGWGRDAFAWTDPTTLQRSSAEHENLQLRASAATFYPPIGFIVAQYTRQRLYEGGSTTNLCVPRGAAGALACSTTATAAPTESNDDLLTGELRRFFTERFALGFVVTRNVTQRETAYEVPVYFVPDANGRLTGGIAAQWSSDNRSVRMVAFIGTVFGALYEKP